MQNNARASENTAKPLSKNDCKPTRIVADDSSPFSRITIIDSDMRTIKDGGLVPCAAHVVHPKGVGDLAKVRILGVQSKRVPHHPGQFLWRNSSESRWYKNTCFTFTKPANYPSIFDTMVIIADGKASDKDVSFVRSRPSQQFDLWGFELKILSLLIYHM